MTRGWFPVSRPGASCAGSCARSHPRRWRSRFAGARGYDPGMRGSSARVLGRNPIGVLEHDIGANVHPPRVVLVTSGGAPQWGVVLIHRRRDGDRGGKRHPSRHVVEDSVADPHRLNPAPVAALQTLDREAELSCLAEVVGRADDHPVLGRPTLGPPGFALSLWAALLGSPL